MLPERWPDSSVLDEKRASDIELRELADDTKLGATNQ